MFKGMNRFKKEMAGFTKRVPKEGIQLVRKTGRQLFGDIVSSTPKDTNFASSEWDYTINQKPPTKEIRNPRSGSYTPAPTPSLLNYKPDDALYIFNNVVYIRKLEDGYSKKAPKNFVKNAVERANRKLVREFRRMK